MNRIVREAVEPALGDAGFQKAGRLSWVRATPELEHVVALLNRRGAHWVQWGIVSPDAVPIMWGSPHTYGDVALAVMTGTPSSIRHPAPGAWFRLQDSNDETHVTSIAEALRPDLRVTEERLREFQSRRDVREYLLLNRDRIDRRDFVIPANLPLKLFKASALAILDRDPAACELVPEVERLMASFDGEPAISRMQRLRATAAQFCS